MQNIQYLSIYSSKISFDRIIFIMSNSLQKQLHATYRYSTGTCSMINTFSNFKEFRNKDKGKASTIFYVHRQIDVFQG